MKEHTSFYINGGWVAPVGEQVPRFQEVVDPSTEAVFARVALGSVADVDAAVAAARSAFESYAMAPVAERLALLDRLIAAYQHRQDDIAQAISREMGAPLWLSKAAQTPMGLAHLQQSRKVLEALQFEFKQGSTLVSYEPIGIVGMITPWNWPMNQMLCKLAPALAAGCTVVLKPSEMAPLSGLLLAEIMDEVGVPPGVFNLVNGTGPEVGGAMSRHPGIDMMTFTGSTRAGVAVAQESAPTVKRVTQELGGKSACIILDDADLDRAVKQGVLACFANSGQSCNAPTRMLVPASLQDEVIKRASALAEHMKVDAALAEGRHMGPVANQAQFERVQALIQIGIDEGATLVAGGVGRPEGQERGYFVRPTIFAHVRGDMTIAREEIFGPVLSILAYDDEDEAVRLANDSAYGLSGYVYSANLDRARRVAARLRTGMVHLNGAPPDVSAPFGGYKQSGNGREWGEFGMREFQEVKAIMGFEPA